MCSGRRGEKGGQSQAMAVHKAIKRHSRQKMSKARGIGRNRLQIKMQLNGNFSFASSNTSRSGRQNALLLTSRPDRSMCITYDH